jgi:hypothetical protein
MLDSASRRVNVYSSIVGNIVGKIHNNSHGKVKCKTNVNTSFSMNTRLHEEIFA